jgi:hypothetical protein
MRYVSLALVVVLVGACSDSKAPPRRESPERSIGEECNTFADCRSGLACEERICAARANTGEGGGCDFTGDCSEGLYCGPEATCIMAGTTPMGSPCGTTAECVAGAICLAEGLTGRCGEAGNGDLAGACTTDADCLAGFQCGRPLTDPVADAQCLPPGQGIPDLFAGVVCEGDSATLDAPMRMYFEVAGETDEFYRLPFPNDVRRTGGRPDLATHPTPGEAPLGFDIVRRYADAVTATQDGFGLNQAVYMRFSGRLDFDILKADGETPTHYLVDITPESPEYNQHQPVFWQAATGGNKYLCHNWLSMRPSWGRPLNVATTYAAVVTRHAKGDNGETLERDEHFALMLGENRPSGTLAPAWDVYAPLRTWIAAEGLSADEIVGAAVFTTGDPRAVTRSIRGAVHAGEASTLGDLVRCDAGVSSPCEDGIEGEGHLRGCFAAASGRHELHSKVDLPIFQKGTAPYAAEGGAIALENGVPVEQGRAEVCTAMVVPDADAPEEGWGAIVYGHGTDGSFRSHATGVADLLTSRGEDATRFVIIGWDQIHHGDRVGDSEVDTQTLVFNFQNPDAARGNWHQSVAEIHAMVRMTRAIDIAAEDSPTGMAIKINPDRVYFYGHSQGGTAGALALPYEPDVSAAVLSGTGGGLVLSLLNKTNPVNIPAGVAIALQEGAVGSNHPVLNFIQGYFDEVDPVNYAEYIGARQIEGETTPRHVLHTMGLGDTVSPVSTLEAYATGLRGAVVGPLYEPFESRTVEAVDPPVTENASVGGERYTVVSRQYRPAAGDDGHFVVFRVDAAQDDVREFFDSAATLGIPVITD